MVDSVNSEDGGMGLVGSVVVSGLSSIGVVGEAIGLGVNALGLVSEGAIA